MSFFRWRDRAIFRASSAPLDPDELKLHFRRRVLKLCFLVGLAILGYPVLETKRAGFRTDRETRKVAHALLAARTLAARSRVPVAFELAGPGKWQVFEYPGADDCVEGAADRVLRDTIETRDMSWQIFFLEATNSTGIGASASRICFHPVRGLYADSQAVANGWVYLLIRSDATVAEAQPARQLVLSNSGSEIQINSLN